MAGEGKFGLNIEAVYVRTEDGPVPLLEYLDGNASAGPEGPEGPRGPEGPEGPRGPAGADGTNGADGADGFGTEAQYDDIIARLVALETADE